MEEDRSQKLTWHYVTGELKKHKTNSKMFSAVKYGWLGLRIKLNYFNICEQ